jgi:L-rhamnose mutarotase
MSAGNKKKRYMFRTAVKPEKLELYKLHHAMVWEAVEVGLRSSGVDLLTIWGDKQHGNVLQMYIETTGADLATITGPGTDGYVPEWEELMQSFFEAGQWVEMDEIYTLTSNTSTNATGEQLVALKKKLENLEQSEEKKV